ncbi:MAG TPA: hypothetical protein VGM90_00835 [Kofleriaceae bacterium]|jgi:hypothetical protein
MSDRHWDVYDGERRVLTVSSAPGAIVSTAHLPAGQPARQCAFMSATSHSPDHEHRFNQVLEASRTVDEFVDTLKADGLAVAER